MSHRFANDLAPETPRVLQKTVVWREGSEPCATWCFRHLIPVWLQLHPSTGGSVEVPTPCSTIGLQWQIPDTMTIDPPLQPMILIQFNVSLLKHLTRSVLLHRITYPQFGFQGFLDGDPNFMPSDEFRAMDLCQAHLCGYEDSVSRIWEQWEVEVDPDGLEVRYSDPTGDVLQVPAGRLLETWRPFWRDAQETLFWPVRHRNESLSLHL